MDRHGSALRVYPAGTRFRVSMAVVVVAVGCLVPTLTGDARAQSAAADFPAAACAVTSTQTDLPFALTRQGGVGGRMRAVAVGGQHVFLAIGDRISALDASNPLDVREVGRLGPLRALDLALSGRYLYTVDGRRLVVVDVADPAAIRIVGRLEPDFGSIQRPDMATVAAGNGYAYAAGSQVGLRVIDVSDPTAPREVGRAATTRAAEVAVAGGTVFVAGFTAGLQVVDVTTPTAPRILPSVALDGLPNDVVADGGLVYVAASGIWLQASPGLHVLDPGDPENIEPLGFTFTDNPQALVVRDGIAYVGESAPSCVDGQCGWDQAAVRVVDITRPTEPATIGRVELGVPLAVTGLDVADGRAYAVTGPRGGDSSDWRDLELERPGLHVVDVSDPADPQRVGGFAPPATVRHVAAAGRYALVGDERGLSVVDILDATRPRLVRTLPLGTVKAMAKAGPRAFLVTAQTRLSWHDYALRFVDVANPARPVERLSWTPSWRARDLVARGSLLFATAGFDGLRIVDASDMAHPRELATVPPETGDIADRLVVVGDRAYVTTNSGLTVIDVADPAQPRVLSAIGVPGVTTALASDGQMAYVAAWWGDIEAAVFAIDVRNPARPRLVGQQPLYSLTDRLEMVGRYVLAPLIVYDGDFVAYHVTDEGAFEEAFHVGWPAASHALAVEGCSVLSAGGEDGLLVGALHPFGLLLPPTPGPTARPLERPFLAHLPWSLRHDTCPPQPEADTPGW